MKLKVFALIAAAVSCSVPANASSFFGADIVGFWSNPVFVGQGIDGLTRQPDSTQDNTGTARHTITNSDGNQNAFGLFSSTISFGTPDSSVVTFTGGTVTDTRETIPFSLGTISFTNGTSQFGTSIFGATLTLAVISDGYVFDLGSAQFRFTQTLNTGTDAQNADFINQRTGIVGS